MGLGFSLIISVGARLTLDFGVVETIRIAMLQVFSSMTGTGYNATNFMLWIPFLWSLLLFIMVIGGCAGSAAGGLKTVRVAILFKNSYYEFKRLLHPDAVIPVKFNQKALPEQIVTNVLAFVVLYVMIVVFSILILSLLGIEFVESIGAVLSCMGNVGLSFNPADPSGNFAHFPDIAKWYMTFLMLTGRLEIFTVLFVLSPSFWKR
jgi:trk system potassium uptake protein TrkH